MTKTTKMKRESKINNADELHLELIRLKLLAKEQEKYLGNQYQLLKSTVEVPVRMINSAISWMPGGDLVKELFTHKGSSDKDWVSKLFSVGSSAILNRFLLKRAGLVKRLLLTFVSQQAAGMMNKQRAGSLISKLADWIRSYDSEDKKKSTKKEKLGASSTQESGSVDIAPDFGIPPDSEAS